MVWVTELWAPMVWLAMFEEGGLSHGVSLRPPVLMEALPRPAEVLLEEVALVEQGVVVSRDGLIRLLLLTEALLRLEVLAGLVVLALLVLSVVLLGAVEFLAGF